jgi:hypothetical protein
MIDPRDYIEIQNVLNLYPHIIDDAANYGRAGDVFTDDAVFDAGQLGSHHGVASLIEYWRHSPARKQALETSQLLAHNVANVVITQDDDGTVRCLSRCIGVSKDGRASMAVYNDIMRRTPRGWRIAERRLSTMTGPVVT